MRIGTTLTTCSVCRHCRLPDSAAEDRRQGRHPDRSRLQGPAGQHPAAIASFKQVPPHQFSRQIRDGRVFYVYPDPTVCACLYVGDQAAYARYQKDVFEKQLANEQAMTATDMAMTWDWGPWGGWPYGWY